MNETEHDPGRGSISRAIAPQDEPGHGTGPEDDRQGDVADPEPGRAADIVHPDLPGFASVDSLDLTDAAPRRNLGRPRKPPKGPGCPAGPQSPAMSVSARIAAWPEPCESCGREVARALLTLFRGRRLCPACMERLALRPTFNGRAHAYMESRTNK